MPSVNPNKTQLRAAQTRLRMVRAAYDLFCELGYRATTMQAIADRAEVAVQTIYFTFRRKDDVLQAVHEWTVLGDNPRPPEQQEWYRDATRATSGPAALISILAGCAAINAKVAPMLPVFHAVAQDPAGRTYARGADLRRIGMVRLAKMLATKTSLAPGMDEQKAADLLFFLTGPECYRELVLLAGWIPPVWAEWAVSTLSRDLFAPRPRR